MPTIFLFDIDGTLIDSHGAGRRAMQGAFAEVVGDLQAMGKVKFAGMTDRAIVRAGVSHAPGVAQDEALIDAVLEGYLARLSGELAAGPPVKVHAGVVACLDRLAPRRDAAVGLGTGNVERGARLKLGAAEIAEHFAFGGFGSDAEDRDEVLRAGAQRGAARLGVPRTRCRVVVIGDTPRDVASAKAIGAQCLAVTTGFSTPDALRDAGAELVVPDLTDAEAGRFLFADP